ncbi:Hypothetical_protein [Hexamita inflata]|uniref:Hypothetical_protein n=1 Tax=Hexamita inflata TaxID=28002 RepID=A0AA86QZB5_9EUKA|nr:Hypothetical protein HINF_LOCUS50363 [Hexamita inflata]
MNSQQLPNRTCLPNKSSIMQKSELFIENTPNISSLQSIVFQQSKPISNLKNPFELEESYSEVSEEIEEISDIIYHSDSTSFDLSGMPLSFINGQINEQQEDEQFAEKYNKALDVLKLFETL